MGFSQEKLEIKKAELEKRRAEMVEKRIQLIEFRKQQKQDRKEQIKSLKIAFISQKLGLTSGEAEKFWPIYNKYDEKIMTLKEGQLKLRLQKKNEATDEEALKKIEEAEEKEAEVMVLKKKMRAELIPIITAEKVLKLERLEQEFHRKLLEKLKGRRGNPPPPRR